MTPEGYFAVEFYSELLCNVESCLYVIRGADKFLARPGKKQTRKHDRDERDFNKIETPSVFNCLLLQGKALKEIHLILIKFNLFKP